MATHRRRVQRPFWEEFGAYLLGEILSTLKIIGFYLAVIFMVVALVMGGYQIGRWALALLLHVLF